MKAAGLFAGIGGLEWGLARAGHSTTLLCEIDTGAREVLRRRLPEVPVHEDVRTLRSLPSEIDLVAAGFPCQDISQAGMTAGIEGKQSSLVQEVFRLIKKHRTTWVLLENVPFMLQLARGRAMEVIIGELERLGYRWAYRVVDTLAFGLPQRRKRVFLLASRQGDPKEVLFADEAMAPGTSAASNPAHGFYWTEGLRGLGWAVDAVPTLKGGSSVGIPSPPAIWHSSGLISTPDIRDAERLQGFAVDWTVPAESVVRPSFRWKLVGNAVSVPVAEWIGSRLAKPGTLICPRKERLLPGDSWPNAAAGERSIRHAYEATHFPIHKPRIGLEAFLAFPPRPLSMRATVGFVSRLERSSLDYPPAFLRCLKFHIDSQARQNGAHLRLEYVHSK